MLLCFVLSVCTTSVLHKHDRHINTALRMPSDTSVAKTCWNRDCFARMTLLFVLTCRQPSGEGFLLQVCAHVPAQVCAFFTTSFCNSASACRLQGNCYDYSTIGVGF